MISENVKKVMTNSIKENKISHCYLIKSSSRINLDDTLIYMINILNNTKFKNLDEIKEKSHNVNILENETNNDLKKENLVKNIDFTNYTSFDSQTLKIVVLKNIENASNNALNSILKTIEEPSNNTCFILTTKNIEKVLKTIRSRSIIINVFHNNFNDIYESFIKAGYSQIYSWIFATLFKDIKNENKKIPISYQQLFKELIESFNKSFNKPQKIYIYLAKYNNKNSVQEFMFLISCLCYLSQLNKYYYLPDYILKNNQFKILLDNLNRFNFKFSYFINASDKFINAIENNGQFILQAENLLSELMRCYDV